MKIEQLLEKKESIQIDMLRYLVLAKGELSINDLFKKVKLSKNAFEQYLKDLEDVSHQVGQAFTLVFLDNRVSVRFSPNFSLEFLIVKFLKESLKYQLLMLHLTHKNLSTNELAAHLLVSESTLFRKQKELNLLLEEFDVQLKNGRLIGEELQIRYLYFELLTFVQMFGLEKTVEETNEDFRLIRTLERVLAMPFNEVQNEQVLCYLFIMRKRMGVREPVHVFLHQELRKFENDALFMALDELMSIYLASTTIELNQDESLLLYVFLTSFYLLSVERFYEYDLVRSQKLPTPKLDIFIREKILLYYRPRYPKIEMEKKMGYQISQANSQLFWFKGKLEIYQKEHIFQQLDAIIGEKLSLLLNNLLQTVLLEMAQPYDEKNMLYDDTLIHYASILTMIDYNIAKPITIGIALDKTNFLSQPQEERLFRELIPLTNVVVESFDWEQKYDVVISNGPKLNVPKETVYYQLSEFFSPLDIEEIKEIIQQERLKNS